ncbi:MAG: histidinol dehydrogenase [Aestuariibacter sp.]
MINWQSLSPAEQKTALARPGSSQDDKVRQAVSDIVRRVQNEGDAALLAYTHQFDNVSLEQPRLDKQQLQQLADSLDAETADAIELAYENIRKFHAAQQPQDVLVETAPGVTCQLKHAPLQSVGLYIPGGTAPLPSTVLMVGTAAQVAGCVRKVLCTPPNPECQIHPAIAYAALRCDIDEVYLVGGAQAIAAMAVGTQSINKVDKIFGPGNSFVTEAKKQVSQLPGGPAIDMPAGPSEVLVLADNSASAAFVASDLLSQAEHGIDSQAILVSDSEALISATKTEVEQQLMQLNRQEIARQAMHNARYILAPDMATAIEISNQYAPEHLIVQTADDQQALMTIRNAGSIFVGPWSPESAGDYASGTNHVLPTYGYARNYSSLGLLDFYRRYTVQELSRQGLENIGPAIMKLAKAEGLDAHLRAVEIRLNGEGSKA